MSTTRFGIFRPTRFIHILHQIRNNAVIGLQLGLYLSQGNILVWKQKYHLLLFVSILRQLCPIQLLTNYFWRIHVIVFFCRHFFPQENCFIEISYIVCVFTSFSFLLCLSPISPFFSNNSTHLSVYLTTANRHDWRQVRRRWWWR
jgi:hypothetical protein